MASKSAIAVSGLIFVSSFTQAVDVERITTLRFETTFDVDRQAHHVESDRINTIIDSEWVISDDNFTWVLGGRVKTDFLDNYGVRQNEFHSYSQLSDPINIGDHSYLELRNFYLDYSPDECDFDADSCSWKIGKQQVVWGQADGIKVLDVVNPQSFEYFILDEYDDSRIPLWTVNYELGFENSELQILWIPDTTAHFVPEPWYAYGNRSVFFEPSPIFHGPPASFEPIDSPTISLSNSDFGFKYATFLDGWDLSVHYLYKLSDFYAMYSDRVIINDRPRTRFRFDTNRNHVIGATATNSFGDLTVRTEMVYTTNRVSTSFRTENGTFRANNLTWVLGLDWYGFGDAMISAQYISDTMKGKNVLANRGKYEDIFTLLYRESFINDKLSIKVIFEHVLGLDDGLVRYSAGWDIDDESMIQLEFNQFYGKEYGTFGQYGKNDHFRLNYEYTF